MACKTCESIPTYTHTLTVQQPGTTVDAAGHVDLTDNANWTTLGQIRARFITKGGRESFVFKQTKAETTHVLMAPSTTLARSLDPAWRLTMGTRVFQITNANDVNEMNREVIIEVTETK